MLKSFLFLMISVCEASLSLNDKIIKDYFDYKFCTMGSIFSCASKKERIELLKRLHSGGLRLSSFDVSNRTFSMRDALTKERDNYVVILDADCPGIEPFLQDCANSMFFYESYRWLVFASAVDVAQKFENVSLYINADIQMIVPNKIENPTNWTTLGVYNPAQPRGGSLVVQESGYYSPEDGFRIKYVGSKYFYRSNMSGTTFKTAMVITENISVSLDEYLDNDEDRFDNTFSRFQSFTVRNCANFYNFRMDKIILDSWGYEQPNGEVDGLVKELKNRNLDFGLVPLMFKLYRLKVMDYGYGNWIMKSAFIFRHPKRTATSYELFLKPLETHVWLVTMATLIVIIVILRFIITKENEVFQEIEEDSGSGDSTWSFLILYSIGEICQQGFAYIPLVASGRIVILTVLIFSFLIYQFYSASLVSYLLLEPPRTIVTLLDLLRSSMQAACEDSLYDRDYLYTTTDPVAIELYNTKIKKAHNMSNFFSPEMGMAKVQHGDFAFHTQTSTAYPIIEKTFDEKSICELQEVKMYQTQILYMTLTKYSPLEEMFNYCMVHQMETGILNRLRIHWSAHKPQCVDPTMYMEIEVGLHESYWALILLAAGIFISLGLLLLEHFWKIGSQRFRIKEKLKEKFTRTTPVEPFVN